jgi:hypothetical protein
MSDTAQKISDDLGDKATQANAFVHIIKITPSDPATNSAPTVKDITVIGSIKSIPLVSKNGELVKNYAEYRYTETPAWYNSSNVTKEECYIATGDNVEELKKWVEARRKKQEKELKAKASTLNSAGASGQSSTTK